MAAYFVDLKNTNGKPVLLNLNLVETIEESKDELDRPCVRAETASTSTYLAITLQDLRNLLVGRGVAGL